MTKTLPWTASLIACLMAVLVSCWLAGVARADEVVLPPGEMLPAHAALIDQANVLDADARAALSARLQKAELRTGTRLGVVLVSSTRAEQIEAYALRLAQGWRIGEARGVLLVVAVTDHRARIEVSRQLSRGLPDAEAARILHDTVTPSLARQAYLDGLMAGVAGIEQALLTLEPAERHGGHRPLWAAFGVFAAMPLVLVVGLWAWVRNRLSWRMCLGIAALFGLVEGVLTALVGSTSMALSVAVVTALAAWLLLLIASGTRKLYDLLRGDRAPGGRSMPSASRRRGRARRVKLTQGPPTLTPTASEAGAARAPSTEADSRSFWQSDSPGGTDDADSADSDTEDTSSANSDFGGSGATSNWS